ncbi:MAG: hypothetical protein WCD24_18285 [Serratia inhibens]
MSSDQIPVSGALAVRFAALGGDIEQVSQLAQCRSFKDRLTDP